MPGASGAEVPTVDPFKYDKLARRLRRAAREARRLGPGPLGLKAKHLRNAADLLECYTPPAAPELGRVQVEITDSGGATWRSEALLPGGLGAHRSELSIRAPWALRVLPVITPYRPTGDGT